MNMSQMVLDFHIAMDVPYNKKPTIPDIFRVQLRQDLINEECNELCIAIQNRNLIHIAKESADVLYVVIGTLHEFGLANCFGDVFTRVHQSNMSKLGPDGKAIKDINGKVVKPPTYIQPDIFPIIAVAQQ